MFFKLDFTFPGKKRKKITFKQKLIFPDLFFEN